MLAVCAPVVAVLCLTLWRTPLPISEAMAIFEDVVNYPLTRFLIPDTSYYRPLFHVTISAIWHNAGSLEAALAGIKLLHIVPILLVITVFVWHLRPRTSVEAAAAALAVAILVGSPGFRDNLELPLSYTIVGMPVALLVWIMLARERRMIHPVWHQAAIVLLTLVAIGFKEQGLVVVPLVLAAWWTRAPGARGATAAVLVALTGAYVALRLIGRESWPMFEQAVGLGFGEMEPAEAAERYGTFPYLLYAYSGVSTIANVLFAEPTRGTFSIVRALVNGQSQPWQLVHLASSVALTTIIGWWGVRRLRDAARTGWSPEARVFVTLLVVLLASGVLSFSYSRDRLGGMAVPFYAMAAFYALRAAGERVLSAPRAAFAAAAVLLLAVSAAWQVRAVGTIERARFFATRNQAEWLVLLPERRLEFADRRTYLRIMDAMLEQGTGPDAPRPTRYPRWMSRWVGEW